MRATLVASALCCCAAPAAAASYGWLKGTTWHWNSWRYVLFGEDQVFYAPDAACANQSCTWSADADSVYVEWGSAGRHRLQATAMRAAAGTELRGERERDGDACSAAWVAPLRGVAPGSPLERFYELQRGEGLASLLPPSECGHVGWAQVNDDYCDCGYDEPHTAACAMLGVRPDPSGQPQPTDAAAEQSRSFWCGNAGFRGHKLLVSRLGDGICDCCDGSDEPDGACPSTCAELAAKENVGLQKKLDEVTKALAAKKSGEEGGQQALREWKAELPKLQAELAALVPTFGSLSAAHDALLRTEASQNAKQAAAAAAALPAAEAEAEAQAGLADAPEGEVRFNSILIRH